MLPRQQRLTTRQFQDVYQRGSVYPGRLVVLRALPRDEGPTRWGFAVGKKLVRDAPARAKWRRRLRSVVEPITLISADCVVTMRQTGLRATLPELYEEIAKLLGETPEGAGGVA